MKKKKHGDMVHKEPRVKIRIYPATFTEILSVFERPIGEIEVIRSVSLHLTLGDLESSSARSDLFQPRLG